MSLNKRAGFTIVELLVATAVGAILLLILNQILLASAQGQSRAEVSLPLQQSVRGAQELIDMNLREANGVRVLYYTTSNGVPASLSTYSSSATQLTVVSAPSGQSFGIQQPAGYGSAQAQVAAGTYTELDATPYADPSTNPPTIKTKTCSQIFGAGDWFLLVEPTRPVLSTSGTYSSGGATTTYWGQAGPVPCLGNYLFHPAYSYSAFQWTPSAAVLKLDITTYYLGTASGVPVLYRQKVGSAAQVVAFDITGMQLQYSSDGQTFSSTPVSSPISVRVTLTATASRQPLGPGSLPTYSASMTTFMRKTNIQNPGTAFSSSY